MPNHLKYLLENAEIEPMVNQIEVHPGWATNRAPVKKKDMIFDRSWAPLGEAAALSNEVLQRIAKKYDHTTAQVCLRWGIQQGILPLPKSVHKNRIEENTHIFDFELTDDEMDVIGSLRNLGGQCKVPDQVDF